MKNSNLKSISIILAAITMIVTYVMPNALLSQDKLTGTVKITEEGENEGIPGVKIQWLGTSIGTISKQGGKFSIPRTTESNELVVSFTGYQSDTLFINKYLKEVDVLLLKQYGMEEIVVEGKKQTTKIDKSSMVRQETITERGLQKAACCNLAESFVTNAAVDVSATDAVSGARKVKLLGLDGKYSQIMTENIPTIRGLAQMYGMNYIPGSWIESISIAKGASSVRNGFESMTGQINVEYKKPMQTVDKAFVNLFANEMGRLEANLNGKYDVTDKLSTGLYLHGSMMQNEMDHNGDNFTDHPIANQLNMVNYWEFAGTNRESKTGIKALIDERGGGQIGSEDDPSLYGIDVNTNRVELFTKNGFIFDPIHAHEEGEEDLRHSLGTIINFVHHDQESRYGNRVYDAQQNSFYANFIYDRELSHHFKINAGGSFQYDNYIETLDSTDFSQMEAVPGVFSELTWQMTDHASVTGGIRADHHNEYGLFFTPRVHTRIEAAENFIIRASAGKGYRSSHIFAENTQLLVSSRKFVVSEGLDMEEAWNYGISTMFDFDIAGVFFTWTVDFYRTDFINQVVTDLDTDPTQARFYNLDGESYSNSLQTDIVADITSNFTITSAYRYNDVQQTINGELRQKPLMSAHKGFINFEYSTDGDSWRFDFTADVHGPGRLPDTQNSPEQYVRDDDFPAYTLFSAQVTKRIGDLDFYIGGENLGDYTQSNPIIAHDEPFSEHFDSSMIWAPVQGRRFYVGIRYSYY